MDANSEDSCASPKNPCAKPGDMGMRVEADMTNYNFRFDFAYEAFALYIGLSKRI